MNPYQSMTTIQMQGNVKTMFACMLVHLQVSQSQIQYIAHITAGLINN